jgi:hypothetical protein
MPGANLPDWDKWLNQQDEHIQQYQQDAELQRTQIQKMQTLMNSTIGDYIKQIAPEASANFDFGKQLRDIYASETVPAMQRYMKEAEGYDTPGRRNREAIAAQESVRRVGEQQDNASMAQLRSAGIDPNDPRYAAARGYDDANQAAAQATAANKARYDVEDRGRAMRSSAIELGQGIGNLGQQYTQTGAQFAGAIPQAVQNQQVLNSALQAQNQSTYSFQSDLTKRLLDTRLARYQTGANARAAAGGGMASGLGGAIGTLAGAGLGAWAGSAGGPAGMAFGASMGARLGGSLGGAAGTVAQPQGQPYQVPAIY